MRFVIALAALAALAVAASPLPAIAQATGETSGTPAATAPAKAKAKKICRDNGKMTGSRMGGGRKCHTAAEWAVIDSGGKSVEAQSSQLGAISRTNR